MKIARPEESVADGIVAEIRKTTSVDADSLSKLRELLLSGNAKAEDWRFLIESSQAKNATHGKQDR